MDSAPERDIGRLLRQQTALATFGELALHSSDLDEILTEACRIVGEALGTDLAKVVELQSDGHTLRVVAGVGWKPGVIGSATIEVTDETSEGRALKTGEPVISPDISLETRFSYPPFLLENNVKAVSNGGEGRIAVWHSAGGQSRSPRVQCRGHGFSAHLCQPHCCGRYPLASL
jgi:hypothetical protein